MHFKQNIFKGSVIPLLPKLIYPKKCINCIYKLFLYFILSLIYTISSCLVLKRHLIPQHHASVIFLASKLASHHASSPSCPIRLGSVSLGAACCNVFVHLVCGKTLVSIWRPASLHAFCSGELNFIIGVY